MSLTASLVYGSWLGGLIRISRFVELLEHYAQAKADLEQRIAELKSAEVRRIEGTVPNAKA